MIRTVKTILISSLCFILTVPTAWAQEAWSLERAVRHAQETNLSIQQASVTVRNSMLTQKQAKASRLPSVQGSLGLNEQLGRTIDPFTNTYKDISIASNNIGVSANMVLYAGGQIKNQIKQSEWDVLASRADAEQIASNLALQVAQAYLTILLTEEQLKTTQNRVAQSRQQLSNTLKLIRVGTLPAADSLNLVAQIARDEQTLVATQNNLDLSYLNLKQLLQLEPDAPFAIEKPTVIIPADANPDAYTLKSVFNTALSTQATIKAGDFRIKSAESGLRIAQAGYYPQVSLFANLNSVYSSQAINVVGNGIFSPTPPTTVILNGTQVTVSYLQEGVTTQKIAYGQQLKDNFGQSFGVGVNVPIYQNSRTDVSVQRAKLGILSAQIQNNQTRQQLKTDIQTAIANARAARKQLEASQKTYNAQKMAFENMQKRFSLGAVNGLELTTAQNNLNSAENDLVVSRYDYLFKLKIIDFYNGKKLSLE